MQFFWLEGSLSLGLITWKDMRRKFVERFHHTNDYRQYFHVGNTAQHCRLGLFQDSDFAGDFEDSKSTSGEILCIFGSRAFVPISWMCKKQTSVSHNSTESEIISLDAGFRMDGIAALDLWDVVMEVLHSSKNTKSPTQQAQGNLSRNSNTSLKTRGNRDVDKLSDVWIALSQNASSSQM